MISFWNRLTTFIIRRANARSTISQRGGLAVSAADPAKPGFAAVAVYALHGRELVG